MTRVEVVALIRAELSDCESEAVEDEMRARMMAHSNPSHPAYALTLVRLQFYRARAAAWRDHARRLRDLLTEMGEA